MARTKNLALALLLLIPGAARAGDPEYHQIVSQLTSRCHRQPTGSVLSFLASCFTPSGISHFKMACFEHLPLDQRAPDADFEAVLRSAATPAFQPFVHTRSNRDHSCVYVYVRDLGKKAELLIVAWQPDQAVVMTMRLDPKALAQWVDQPEDMAQHASKPPA